MENKDSLRQSLRKQRSLLSRIQQQKKSQNIIDRVIKTKAFETATNIGYYHAVRGEADPEKLNRVQKQFYLPIVISEKSISSAPQGLVFAPVSDISQYQDNIFKIPEPVCESSELINADKLDLLIMPLLGFDRSGNRLGMGGGFYDRTLSYKKNQPEGNPVLMGFAYDFQEVAALQAESWDIGLDWIVTESEIIKCR